MKTCQNCKYSSNIRGTDSANKLGCRFHWFKVDIAHVCDDLFLSDKQVTNDDSKEKGESVTLSLPTENEKEEAEKSSV